MPDTVYLRGKPFLRPMVFHGILFDPPEQFYPFNLLHNQLRAMFAAELDRVIVPAIFFAEFTYPPT